MERWIYLTLQYCIIMVGAALFQVVLPAAALWFTPPPFGSHLGSLCFHSKAVCVFIYCKWSERLHPQII